MMYIARSDMNFREYFKIKLFILLIASPILSSEAVDRNRLTVFPKPARNFDLQEWVSRPWYSQARYIPCSFSGSTKFSNIRLDGRLFGNHVKQSMTWRDGVCSTVMLRLEIVNNGDGHFIQIDPIGGMVTGDQVTIVYNPKKGYDINWGCTKKSVDGDCSDPWLLVKTRDRFPHRYVWECIIRDLRNLYDISLKEMLIIDHKNPC